MLKQSILLLSMVPTIALGHDWDNEYWVERLTRNHVKVGQCLLHMQYNEREAFMKNCSVHAMGYTENDVFEEYYQQRALHPEMNDIEFIYAQSHSASFTVEETEQIWANVAIRPVINSAILTLYIADAIIRADAAMDDK